MPKRNNPTECISMLAAAAFCLLAGCAGISPSTKGQPIDNISKILIVPFKDLTAVYGHEGNIRCPLCGDVFAAGAVPEGVEGPLSQKLYDIMSERFAYELVASEEVGERLPDLIASEARGDSERARLSEIGRHMEADALLIGHIYRYQNRVGVAYSADSPASVAFDLHLLQVSDGRIVWTGRFDETQSALSENALKIGTFLKSGGQWMTADQMAALGIEDVLKSFPKQ